MPGLGATGGGKLQLSVGWRQAKATDSYFKTRLNSDFNRKWVPRERLSTLDVTARYRLSKRFAVIATLPIVMNKFSTLMPPVGFGSQRGSWDASGIGDLSVYAQGFVFDPRTHPFGNINLGLGIKIPSGSWQIKSTIPDETGNNRITRAVWPPAIMPGDGGTGIIAGFEAFKTLRGPSILRGNTIFAGGSYLSNPRVANGTPSAIQELGVPLAPQFLNELTNSVPDTYNLQAGTALKVPGTWDKKWLRGLRVRAVWRWEGLTIKDLIGRSSGYRQPGYAMSIGPGISYAYGRDLLIVDVPILITQYVDPIRTALPGLPVRTKAGFAPNTFNPSRNMGLIAPVSIAVRYVRTF